MLYRIVLVSAQHQHESATDIRKLFIYSLAFLKNYLFFNWRIIALQNCVGFCQTSSLTRKTTNSLCCIEQTLFFNWDMVDICICICVYICIYIHIYINIYIKQCVFKVYSVLIWYIYLLQYYYHHSVSKCLCYIIELSFLFCGRNT